MKLVEYALYKMIFETCGEDPETLENAKVTEIAKNTYHVQYKEKDPYDGMDFKVKLHLDRLQGKPICYYDITDSVWGDNGTFKLDLVSRD